MKPMKMTVPNDQHDRVVDRLETPHVFVHPLVKQLVGEQEYRGADQQLGQPGDDNAAEHGHYDANDAGNDRHPAAGRAELLEHYRSDQVGGAGRTGDQRIEHIAGTQVRHLGRGIDILAACCHQYR